MFRLPFRPGPIDERIEMRVGTGFVQSMERGVSGGEAFLSVRGPVRITDTNVSEWSGGPRSLPQSLRMWGLVMDQPGRALLTFERRDVRRLVRRRIVEVTGVLPPPPVERRRTRQVTAGEPFVESFFVSGSMGLGTELVSASPNLAWEEITPPPPDEPQPAGGGGSRCWRFVLHAPGTATILFRHRSLGAPDMHDRLTINAG